MYSFMYIIKFNGSVLNFIYSQLQETMLSPCLCLNITHTNEFYMSFMTASTYASKNKTIMIKRSLENIPFSPFSFTD